MTDEDRNKRTLTDHGRMLWRDDVEGHCDSPDLCFEHGGPVRCSPCAIKQATAAGVTTLDPDRAYLPEVCRLRREIEQLRSERRRIVSHASGGRTDGEEMSVNEVCVAITGHRNAIYAEGIKKGQGDQSEVLSAISKGALKGGGIGWQGYWVSLCFKSLEDKRAFRAVFDRVFGGDKEDKS